MASREEHLRTQGKQGETSVPDPLRRKRQVAFLLPAETEQEARVKPI